MDMDLTQVVSFDFGEDSDESEANILRSEVVGNLKIFQDNYSLNAQTFSVYVGENDIGRSTECKIYVNSKSLSKRHAVIEASSDSCCIYDNSSLNKTHKGKKSLKPNIRYNLEDGEELYFGNVRATFHFFADKSDLQSDTDSDSLIPVRRSSAKSMLEKTNGLDADVSHSSAKCLLETTAKNANRNSSDETDIEASELEEKQKPAARTKAICAASFLTTVYDTTKTCDSEEADSTADQAQPHDLSEDEEAVDFDAPTQPCNFLELGKDKNLPQKVPTGEDFREVDIDAPTQTVDSDLHFEFLSSKCSNKIWKSSVSEQKDENFGKVDFHAATLVASSDHFAGKRCSTVNTNESKNEIDISLAETETFGNEKNVDITSSNRPMSSSRASDDKIDSSTSEVDLYAPTQPYCNTTEDELEENIEEVINNNDDNNSKTLELENQEVDNVNIDLRSPTVPYDSSLSDNERDVALCTPTQPYNNSVSDCSLETRELTSGKYRKFSKQESVSDSESIAVDSDLEPTQPYSGDTCRQSVSEASLSEGANLEEKIHRLQSSLVCNYDLNPVNSNSCDLEEKEINSHTVPRKDFHQKKDPGKFFPLGFVDVPNRDSLHLNESILCPSTQEGAKPAKKMDDSGDHLEVLETPDKSIGMQHPQPVLAGDMKEQSLGVQETLLKDQLLVVGESPATVSKSVLRKKCNTGLRKNAGEESSDNHGNKILSDSNECVVVAFYSRQDSREGPFISKKKTKNKCLLEVDKRESCDSGKSQDISCKKKTKTSQVMTRSRSERKRTADVISSNSRLSVELPKGNESSPMETREKRMTCDEDILRTTEVTCKGQERRPGARQIRASGRNKGKDDLRISCGTNHTTEENVNANAKSFPTKNAVKKFCGFKSVAGGSDSFQEVKSSDLQQSSKEIIMKSVSSLDNSAVVEKKSRGRPKRSVNRTVASVSSLSTDSISGSLSSLENLSLTRKKSSRGLAESAVTENNTEQVFENSIALKRRTSKRVSDMEESRATRKKSRSAPSALTVDNGSKGTDCSILRSPRKKAKPIIMFTGIEREEEYKRKAVLFGAEISENVMKCTHLVTDKFHRTIKFLCCVARGVYIVSEKWILDSEKAKSFLDVNKYLLKDKVGESRYSFDLGETLAKSRLKPLLGGWSVTSTRSVIPKADQLKDIVTCAGGKFVHRVPKKPNPSFVIIADEKDRVLWAKDADRGMIVVGVEFLLTGILQYSLDYKKYRML